MKTGVTVYIYGLVDPRDFTIRYVGKTLDMAQRRKDHLRESSRSAKGVWIAELKSQGLEPLAVMLDSLDAVHNPDLYEGWWMQFGTERCQWKLTNTQRASLDFELPDVKYKHRPAPTPLAVFVYTLLSPVLIAWSATDDVKHSARQMFAELRHQWRMAWLHSKERRVIMRLWWRVKKPKRADLTGAAYGYPHLWAHQAVMMRTRGRQIEKMRQESVALAGKSDYEYTTGL